VLVGVTLQWRFEPGDRNNRSFTATAEFGGHRDHGTGYMAYSDRVGPGVILVAEDVDDDVKAMADALNDEGFTVLAPYQSGAPQLAAAVEHLSTNWHPRVGAIGLHGGVAAACALAGAMQLDALVLIEGVPETNVDHWRTPILVYKTLAPSELEDAWNRTTDFLHYNLS
jgi:hypothetical protein